MLNISSCQNSQFQPTRPLRGATPRPSTSESAGDNFNPRAPCGARPQVIHFLVRMARIISTHAPLAGRDNSTHNLFITRICISTHAPLAGRDIFNTPPHEHTNISTHAPLAGRDLKIELPSKSVLYISTHAPLAGRDPSFLSTHFHKFSFQPTRPLRGATSPASW